MQVEGWNVGKDKVSPRIGIGGAWGGDPVGAGARQTRERIAQKYTACQFISWLSFERGRKPLKCLQVTSLKFEIQEQRKIYEEGFQEAKELAALARMADDKIDLTDAPEVRE